MTCSIEFEIVIQFCYILGVLANLAQQDQTLDKFIKIVFFYFIINDRTFTHNKNSDEKLFRTKIQKALHLTSNLLQIQILSQKFQVQRNFVVTEYLIEYNHYQILPIQQIMKILKGDIFSSSFFLLLLLIQVGNCGLYKKISPRTPSISNLTDNSFSNQTRLLQAQRPHGFRIYGDLIKPVPANAAGLVDAGRTLFSISRLYFMKAIMVNNLPQDDTKFNASQQEKSQCDAIMPKKYIQNGFDQKTIDMVMFIRFLEVNSAWTAQATNCDFSVRPIYGLVDFSIYRLAATLTVSFQLAVQSVIHQMFHILGFSDPYYITFWTDRSRTVRRNQSDVMRKVNGRWMIVTPKVREYVRSYFGCNNNQIGAALEDNGGNQTILAHWEKTIYRNELMTGDEWVAGKRITQLTLALLDDTNFYEVVDKSVSEPANWGYRKGCSFASGDSSAISKECEAGLNINSTCDYYGDIMSSCMKTPLSGQAEIQVSLQNSMCSSPQNSQFFENFMEFGQTSKCLRVTINRPVYSGCYKAQCNSDSTLITFIVSNFTKMCRMPNQTFAINGLKIQCPSNFKAFCFVKKCQNNCNNRGLCLNGKCICDSPWTGNFCNFNKI